MSVRVQNKDGMWLRDDRTWTPSRDRARRFGSIEEAEAELQRIMEEWMGQVVFDVTADG